MEFVFHENDLLNITDIYDYSIYLEIFIMGYEDFESKKLFFILDKKIALIISGMKDIKNI